MILKVSIINVTLLSVKNVTHLCFKTSLNIVSECHSWELFLPLWIACVVWEYCNMFIFKNLYSWDVVTEGYAKRE